MARISYLRFDIWLVTLDPVKGSEIKKTRPCVIISPQEINLYMNTVIIAPLTSTLKNFPFRLDCDFQSHKGQIALDHIRSVDKSRLIKKIGKINDATGSELLHLLIAIFEL